MHDFLQKAYIAQMDQKIKEQVTFAPEIPWLERETQVLYKLNRTLAEKIADAVCECGKSCWTQCGLSIWWRRRKDTLIL